MAKRALLSALLFGALGALAQAPDPGPDSVRAVSVQKSAGPDLIEWVHTLDCRADGAVPSLRVTLGNSSSSASAGVAMVVGADERASGTITVRVQMKDKEARTALVTVDVGAADGAIAGQTVHLPAGQDLAAVAAELKPLPPGALIRRAIVVGNVAGCMISAYVMPGRTTARPTAGTTPPPGDPAAQAAEVFRTWVRGVKQGDLDAFSAVVPPNEWNGMDAEQRTRRLQEYQQSFKTVLGENYGPDEFKVEYTPGANVGAGKLKVRYADKELPDLNIRFFGGKWVLSEP